MKFWSEEAHKCKDAIKSAIATLEFYADETMYKIFPSAEPETKSPAEMDMGLLANGALPLLREAIK